MVPYNVGTYHRHVRILNSLLSHRKPRMCWYRTNPLFQLAYRSSHCRSFTPHSNSDFTLGSNKFLFHATNELFHSSFLIHDVGRRNKRTTRTLQVQSKYKAKSKQEEDRDTEKIEEEAAAKKQGIR